MRNGSLPPTLLAGDKWIVANAIKKAALYLFPSLSQESGQEKASWPWSKRDKEATDVSGEWLPFSFEAPENFGQQFLDLYLTAPVNNKIARELFCRGMKVRLFRMRYQDINRVVLQAVCLMSRCGRRADHLEFLESWPTELKIMQN